MSMLASREEKVTRHPQVSYFYSFNNCNLRGPTQIEQIPHLGILRYFTLVSTIRLSCTGRLTFDTRFAGSWKVFGAVDMKPVEGESVVAE